MSQTPECSKCNAICCKHVALQIDKPSTKREYDNIRWYLMHRNIDVFIDHENDWYVKFDSTCDYLRGNMCDTYENRPKICREYPDEDNNCEFEGEGESYIEIFHNETELENYLNKKGIDWKYKNHDK